MSEADKTEFERKKAELHQIKVDLMQLNREKQEIIQILGKVETMNQKLALADKIKEIELIRRDRAKYELERMKLKIDLNRRTK